MQNSPSSTSRIIPIATSNVNQSKPRVALPSRDGSGLPPAIVVRTPESLRSLVPGYALKVVDGNPVFEIDDPVFEVREAAAILGISKELLDKWRARGQGPEFIQYLGGGGPVRYRYSTLEAFKSTYTVHPSRQPESRRSL